MKLTSNIAFAIFAVTTGLSAVMAEDVALQSNSNDGLRLSWKDRFLEIKASWIHGKVIRTHYLEAYCRPGSTDQEWGKTVIRHESRLVAASDDGRRLEIEDNLEDGVIVKHVIEASQDEVHFSVVAHNPTNKVSAAHWAQPCMRVDRFTGTSQEDSRAVFPPYIKKCFLFVDNKLVRLPTKPWALEARYIPGQVYAAPMVNRNDVNPRPLSKLVPSSPLCGCFSADGKQILAVAWQPYQEIFQGVITCMHNDFRIGGLKPGESKTIEGRLYVLPNDVELLSKRFHEDFPSFAEKDKATK